MDFKRLFLENIAQTSPEPLALEFPYAEGCYLYDKNGKAYLDLISGIAVSNVGHRHPKVVEAIKLQADKYLHQMVYGEYVQTPQVLFAKALLETLQGFSSNLENLSFSNVYFTNSGTEAVEAAIKVAKRYNGRAEIISCKKAYHGSTNGALSLGDETFKNSFRPLLPGVKKMERNSMEDLELITTKTAAVFIEPIGGEIGVVESHLCWLKALAQRCKEVNCLLIFDEIQSGFGRTGPFWAFENYGIYPDLLLSAKGMGGGMPIGGLLGPKEILSSFISNPFLGHITTFGGHPISCAAGLATLQVIQNHINKKTTIQRGLQFKKLLQHSSIKEVRGKGLMLAAEMENFGILKQRIDLAIKKGLVTDWFLYCDNSMRIAPPLIISENEVEGACSIILETLEEIS